MSYLYLLLLLPSSIPPYLRHVSVKNGPTPVSFCLLSVFSNKQYNFTTNQCEKMSKFTSSIRRRDSNPQPLERESPLITTRPGLPPYCTKIYPHLHNKMCTSFKAPRMKVNLVIKILDEPTPASFPFIFGLFKQTIQFLQQINVLKCPSSIWRWDSNP